MPFTPLHLGPATVVKLVAPNHFSLIAFAGTQVLIDLESLYNMLTGKWPVHTFFHTYLGSTIMAIASILICALCLNPWLRYWNKRLEKQNQTRLIVHNQATLLAITTGSFIGAYSHVFLDSIMHTDIQPLSPISSTNTLQGLLSTPTLHMVCISSLLVGGISLLVLLWREKIQSPR